MRIHAICLVALIGLWTHGAAAEEYPVRPVKLIVPFPAGAGKKQSDLIRFQFQFGARLFAQRRIRSEIFQRHARSNDVDPIGRMPVKIDNLTLHHFGIRDYSPRALFCKERFLEAQNILMLATDSMSESLQRHLKLSAAIQPSLMHAVARAVHIATPHPLETHQNIAFNLRPCSLELIGESNRRTRLQIFDRSKRPFVRRPMITHDQLGVVAKVDNPFSQPFQINFGAAARRVAAPDEYDAEFAVRHQIYSRE